MTLIFALCSASPNLRPMPGCFVQPYSSLGLARSGSLPATTVGHCHPFSGPCPFSVHPCPVLWPPMVTKCHILASAVVSLMCPPTPSAPHSPYRVYCSIPANYKKHPESPLQPRAWNTQGAMCSLGSTGRGPVGCLAMLQVSQADRQQRSKLSRDPTGRWGRKHDKYGRA